jgi:ATP synthase subunit 6
MASEGMHSPVEQFEIRPIFEMAAGGYDISFTNSSLFMLLAMAVGGGFLFSAMRNRELVPGRMQGAAEMMYEFVADMVRSNVGNDGRAYFPFVFTLFVFLLFGNMLGLIPYSYTFTSQIIVTFAMAGFVFVGVTLIALFKHGLHFFSFFVPQGAPKVLIPFLIVIEGDFLFRAPGQPVCAAFRQHAGRTYDAEGVRWPCGDDFGRWRHRHDRLGAAFSGARRSDRAGSAGSGAPSLCFHHPDMHVSE